MGKDVATTGMDETCVQKKVGLWMAGIGILVCATIVLAFYYAGDIRRARRRRAGIQGGGLWGSEETRTSDTAVRGAGTRAASFVPPWHGKQNPDAVTGATPKRISFNRAIEIVSPSVVGINTSGTQSQGASGIIVHPDGYILTNHHVVKGAKSIVVTLVQDQLIKSYPAELVQGEPGLDLAIIKVGSRGETFPPAPLGDSNRVVIGQDVVAIGNPFGLAQSASAGIISNTQRSLTTEKSVFEGLLQTDASINPGSSGGALVNTNAQVIGVSTAIYSPVQGFTGVGFAVPINQAKGVFRDFIQMVPSPLVKGNALAGGGNINALTLPPTGANLRMVAAPRRSVRRCWLGIDAHPIDDVVVRELDLPVRWGVLVNRVFANSPAGKAGLLRGDLIYRVNNRRVKDAKMFWSHLAGGKTGDKVKITVLRNNEKKTFVCILEPEPPNVRILLSKAPQGAAAGATGVEGIEEISWLGIDIQPLTDPEALQEFGISPSEKGVLVGEVEGVAAIEAGLKPGDLIKKINNREIRDIQGFKETIKKIDLSKGAVLDIIRQKRPYYITIQPIKQNRGAWQ